MCVIPGLQASLCMIKAGVSSGFYLKVFRIRKNKAHYIFL